MWRYLAFRSLSERTSQAGFPVSGCYRRVGELVKRPGFRSLHCDGLDFRPGGTLLGQSTRNGTQPGLDSLFEGGARQQKLSGACGALDADVSSESDDFPLEAAAGVLLAEPEALAHGEVYDQASPPRSKRRWACELVVSGHLV